MAPNEKRKGITSERELKVPSEAQSQKKTWIPEYNLLQISIKI